MSPIDILRDFTTEGVHLGIPISKQTIRDAVAEHDTLHARLAASEARVRELEKSEASAWECYGISETVNRELGALQAKTEARVRELERLLALMYDRYENAIPVVDALEEASIIGIEFRLTDAEDDEIVAALRGAEGD